MAAHHTYRIRHKGVESTPHSLADLRQMWRTGQIDSSTEFKRGDSPVWLEANDLWAELHLDQAGEDPSPGAGSLSPPSSLNKPGARHAVAPTAATPVRITSLRIPFKDILVLVLKFYAASLLLALAAAAAWLLLSRYIP